MKKLLAMLLSLLLVTGMTPLTAFAAETGGAEAVGAQETDAPVGSTLVDSIELTIPAPVTGNLPSHSVTYSGGVEPCYTQTVNNEIAGVYWRDVTDNDRVLSYSEHFVTGHRYRVFIKVIASDGYALRDADYYNNSEHGAVNGSACSVSTEVSGSTEYVATVFSCTFPELDMTFIDSLSLIVPRIFADGAPRYAFDESLYVKPYTAHDQRYSNCQNGIFWRDYTKQEHVSPSGYLASGHVYRVCIMAEAKDGYLFSDDLQSSAVTVNGIIVSAVSDEADTDRRHVRKIEVDIPVTGQGITAAGVCGETCSWMFNSADGTLTVTGTCEMADYDNETDTPWYSFRNDITGVVIGSDVTKVGKNSFRELDSLTAVTLPNTLETINAYAFSACDSLCEISIPAGTTLIGTEAFWQCPLTKIYIPDGVSGLRIGGAAFNCEAVHTVCVPAGVTEIEAGAFGFYHHNGTVKHEDFIISGAPGSTAETYAAANGFTFLNGSGVTGDCRWRYDPETQTLTVSGEGETADYSRYEGLTPPWYSFRNDPDHGIVNLVIEEGVTYIGYDAFHDCSRLSSVSLPDSLTQIHHRAFEDCKSLSAIDLPGNLERIDYGVFMGCDGLTSVRFPESIKWIGPSSFENCELEQITIPSGVSDLEIKYDAFVNNPDVTELYIPAGVTFFGTYALGYTYTPNYNNSYTKMTDFTICGVPGSEAQAYASENGFLFVSVGGTTGDCSWLYDPDVKALTISGTGATGNYTNSADNPAPWFRFRNNTDYGIDSVVVEEGVTTIGNFAFFDCELLTAVSLPDSLTGIKQYAFDCCNSLAAIELPGHLLYLEYGAFINCAALTSVTLPESIRQIADSAFSMCALESVVIPAGVSGLRIDSAFINNPNLKTVFIPSGVTTLNAHAFGYSYDFNTASFNKTPDFTIIGDTGSAAEAYAAENGFTFISTAGTTGSCTWRFDYAANTLTVSGAGAMADYSNSQRAPWYLFRDLIHHVVFEDGVELAGAWSFYDSSNLTSVTFPEVFYTIGFAAFSHCAKLTAVDLPDTLTTLGSYSFEETALTSVVIPDTVDTLSQQAFRGCAALTDVSIPEGVTTIGGSVFCGCPISHIDLPFTLEAIGAGAFQDCCLTEITIPPAVTEINVWALGYQTNSENHMVKIDSFKIKGDSGSAAETYANTYGFTFVPVYITGEHGDCRWTYETASKTLIISGIGAMSDSFGSSSAPWHSYAENIEYLTIKNGVTHLGSYAFNDLYNLKTIWLGRDINNNGNYGSPFPYNADITSITFAEGLTEIPTYLFYSQEALDCTITLPNSVTSIGNRAFARCKKLTTVNFGNSLQTVGAYAFCDCEKLTAAEFQDALITIEMHAFDHCADLQTLDLGDSCEEISHNAFESCTSLQSFTLPDTLTTFGSGVFAGCTSITSINIPASLVNVVNNGPFRYCSNLSTVTFEEGRTEIPQFLFSECTGLTEITLPNTVTTIRRDAFSYCTNLQTVNIPESVDTIESYAFFNCPSLQSLTIPGNLTTVKYNTFYGCTSLAVINLPNTVTTIENGAFNHCGLQHFTVPAGVTNIQSETFRNNTSLQTITFHDNVTYIGQWAFKGCTALQTLTLPQNVATVAYQAFADCTSLTTVNLPLYLCNSGGSNEPFSGCCALRNVNFPVGITKIPSYLLYRTGIEAIDIPETVTEIGSSAFSHCTNLNDVSLPTGLTRIRNSAFDNCTNLDHIYLPSTLTDLESWTFGNTALTSVTIPASLVRANESWQGPFAGCSDLTTFHFAPGTTQIANGLFAGCPGVQAIVIPNGVTEIKSGAFRGCTALTSVTLPAGVTTIGQDCFRDCTALPTLDLPDTVTSIPRECFSGCTALTSVGLSDNLTSIDVKAFYQSGLTAVFIPEGVTTVNDAAFKNCTALASVSLPGSLTTVGTEAFMNTAMTNVALASATANIGAYAFGYETYYTKTEPFTVYGVAGSCAETYANNNAFPFVALTVGNTNLDGTVNIKDVTALQRYLAQLQTMNGLQLELADTNGDGVVGIADATRLQQYLAEYDVALGA